MSFMRHGHARKGQLSRTYRIWGNLKTRCTNPRNQAFPLYGGRGISLCQRWVTFDGFLADMGACPAGKQIDRIDNNRGYEPGNCRWATAKENARNRRSNKRYVIRGVQKTIPEWAEHFGLVRSKTVYERVANGWPIGRAAKTPAAENRSKPNVR